MVGEQFRPGGASSMVPLARASTVDLIAAELRAAIFAGSLPVGSALREVDISAQLGVSRSPFREAAQRLVQEGILTALPGRGIRVTVIPPERVRDLYVERLAVEGHAALLFTREPSEGVFRQSLSAVESALTEYERASQGGDAWEIGDADLAFHQALVDAARSPRLSRAMVRLVIETRIASLSASEGYAVRRSVSPTYRRLIDALAARDGERAFTALEQQFDAAVRRLRGEDDSVDTVETQTDDEPQEFEPLMTDGLER